ASGLSPVRGRPLSASPGAPPAGRRPGCPVPAQLALGRVAGGVRRECRVAGGQVARPPAAGDAVRGDRPFRPAPSGLKEGRPPFPLPPAPAEQGRRCARTALLPLLLPRPGLLSSFFTVNAHGPRPTSPFDALDRAISQTDPLNHTTSTAS